MDTAIILDKLIEKLGSYPDHVEDVYVGAVLYTSFRQQWIIERTRDEWGLAPFAVDWEETYTNVIKEAIIRVNLLHLRAAGMVRFSELTDYLHTTDTLSVDVNVVELMNWLKAGATRSQLLGIYGAIALACTHRTGYTPYYTLDTVWDATTDSFIGTVLSYLVQVQIDALFSVDEVSSIDEFIAVLDDE